MFGALCQETAQSDPYYCPDGGPDFGYICMAFDQLSDTFKTGTSIGSICDVSIERVEIEKPGFMTE
jgi:hypothetical protein